MGSVTAMKVDCGRVFRIRQQHLLILLLWPPPAVRPERLLPRSVNTVVGCRRLSSMLLSVSTLGAVPLDQGLLLGDPLYVSAVRYVRKRNLLHSIKDLPNRMMRRIGQVPEIQSRYVEDENFRSIYALSCGKREIERFTASNRCDDETSSPRPVSTQTKETRSTGGVSHEGCAGVVEPRFVNGSRYSSICIWNEIAYLRW